MNTHLSWSWRAPPADLPWSCYAWFLGLPRPTHVELLTLQSAKKQNDFRLELIFPLFLFTVSLFYTVLYNILSHCVSFSSNLLYIQYMMYIFQFYTQLCPFPLGHGKKTGSAYKAKTFSQRTVQHCIPVKKPAVFMFS